MEEVETTTDPEKVSEESLPRTRAMQDEFTRSFLQSTEEVEEGYYRFRSGTNRFEMNLSTAGKIGEKSYAVDKGFEQVAIGIEQSSYAIGITIEYISHLKKDNLETNLSLFGSIAEELDFDRMQQGGSDRFYSKFRRDENDVFLAYVQNTKDSGGILISYYIDCLETDHSCGTKSQEDEFFKWLKSFQFKEKGMGEEDQ
ncbi:hypothetical protein [Bacillus sp. Cs-700]|uniref:hypothetical protein n=1 Tax=Bacillus sp. Cs-700 TaxID=2589818 RepID=UPI001409E930|nr:hypothetical protein [Bacillus sp. Cs-700]